MASSPKKAIQRPKRLFIDIETKPMIVYCWGLYEQNISEDMIVSDWDIMSFAAKWEGSDKVIQYDRRNDKNDKKLVQKIWDLLDEADIVCGQNSIKFDIKKINARFYFWGLKPPSGYRQIDTKLLAKKNFAFTSNGLAFFSRMNQKYKKLTHSKYPGFSLWKKCIEGDEAAWDTMKEYNIHDVLATEEVYQQLRPWGTGINDGAYFDGQALCACGGLTWKRNGYTYTNVGRYQRWRCTECGTEKRGGENEIKDTKKVIR